MITDYDLIILTLRWMGFKTWDIDAVGYPYEQAMNELRCKLTELRGVTRKGVDMRASASNYRGAQKSSSEGRSQPKKRLSRRLGFGFPMPAEVLELAKKEHAE